MSNTNHSSSSGELQRYNIGMALVGATVGLLVGLSKSPVVGAIVPAIIGILVAFGQLVLTTGGKTEPDQTKVRSGIIGTALILFSVFCVVAMLLGMFFREPALRCELIDLNCGTESEQYLTGSEPAAELELVLLHRYLQLLNLTEANRKHLWKLVQELPVERSPREIGQALAGIDQKLNSLTVILGSATDQGAARARYQGQLMILGSRVSLVRDQIQNQGIDSNTPEIRSAIRSHLSTESTINTAQWSEPLRTARSELLESLEDSLASMGPTRSEILETLKASVHELVEVGKTLGSGQRRDGQLGFESDNLGPMPMQGDSDG